MDDYRSARDAQGALRVMFTLAYVSTALLVLLGAIWVGLSSASRVAEPIGAWLAPPAASPMAISKPASALVKNEMRSMRWARRSTA
ncbi:MAG: hypothetical protein NVV62_01745 [Terricaulis sp.]|nr:hypothetical protein [Terricaulis sp.]